MIHCMYHYTCNSPIVASARGVNSNLYLGCGCPLDCLLKLIATTHRSSDQFTYLASLSEGGDNTTMDDLQDMIDMMGEAPEEMMTQAPPNTNGTSMGTLLPTDCHVSSMVIDSDTVVSMLTVYSANMEQSSNFTCVAKNEVENNIGSPENATVQLVIVGEHWSSFSQVSIMQL